MENRFYIEFISSFDGVFDYSVFDKETREQKRMSCSIGKGVDQWKIYY